MTMVVMVTVMLSPTITTVEKNNKYTNQKEKRDFPTFPKALANLYLVQLMTIMNDVIN